MCWIGENVKQIADENIPIFKLCIVKDSVIKSFYKGFEYKLGTEYTSKIVITDSVWFEKKISEGLHSYHSKISTKKWNTGVILKGLNAQFINVYYHSDVYKPVAKVIGYIPKGSTYYLNDAGEYVSNKLVLTKIINIYD